MRLEYRPFAVMGFTFLSVLLLCVRIYDALWIVTLAAGVLLALVSLLFRSVREKLVPIYVSAALIVSSILFCTVYEGNLKYAQNFIGKTSEIEGMIVEEPDYNSSNSRYYYILKLDKIDGCDIDTKLKLSLPYELDAEVFDTVSLNATLYDIASDAADIKQYYNSKGIFLGAYAYNSEDDYCKIVKDADKNSVDYIFHSLRSEIKHRISSVLPNENGDTLIAILLGEKDNLSDEWDRKFKEVGIAPIFAVSGLHLSIWVMGLYNLLNCFGVKRRSNSIVGIAFTVFFMMLTGLSPSVCRSGLMMLLLLSGNLFYRKSDSLNSLGFAAFVLCIINPLIVADGGFLMSFAATLGIVVLYPLTEKVFVTYIPDTIAGKAFKSVCSAIAVSVSATIGVFPVTVFQIGYISLLTVISNVTVTFFAAASMVSAGLIVLIYPIEALRNFFTLIAGLFARVMLSIVDFLADLTITSVSVDDIFWKVGTTACVIVIIIAVIFLKRKLLFEFITLSLSVIIAITSVMSYFYYDNLTQLKIIDVGNGVSIIARNGDRKILLSSDADGYNMSSAITDNLNSISRRTADLLVIGDNDGAYNTSILEAVDKVGFNEIIVPQTNTSLNSVFDGDKITESTDMLIELWDGATIKSVITEKYSLAYCSFNDVTILVILDSYKYADIPSEYIQADYLISNGYIPNAISPRNYQNVFICGEEKYVSGIEEYVISCGGNPILVDRFKDIIINIRENNHRIYTLEG